MNIRIQRYNYINKVEWDLFVQQAKNSHFMFCRNYMDYHKNKFEDCSLLVYNEKNSLIAIFPANIADDTIYSHQGLTFGGLIVSFKSRAEEVMSIFTSIIDFYGLLGYKKIIYKAIPHIYHLYPSEEDLYALFRINAKIIRRDISSAIYINNRIKFTAGRKSSLKAAINYKLMVNESNNFQSFWELLTQVISVRHGVYPTHTAGEIILLAKYFPNNIKLFTATSPENELLAGVVLFIQNNVFHTQYMASSDYGRKCGALDLVIEYLLNICREGMCFNFGISTENQGLLLNSNLIFQKESFGGRGIVHDFYEINLK